MRRNNLTFTSPKQIWYFPYFFPRSPHIFRMQMNLCFSLLLFFLKDFHISGLYGPPSSYWFLHHFSLSSLFRLLFMFTSGGYLPPCMQTTRSHFARCQHSETEIDKILNTWKSVAFVATHLSGGEANSLFRSFFFFFYISFFIPSIPTVYFRHFTDGDFVFKFYSKQPNS